jgi:hypothetical protein
VCVDWNEGYSARAGWSGWIGYREIGERVRKNKVVEQSRDVGKIWKLKFPHEKGKSESS